MRISLCVGTFALGMSLVLGGGVSSAQAPFMVEDIDPGWEWNHLSSSGNEYVEVGGVIFFTGTDPANGRELWRSDGTEGGAYLLKDIRPGPSGSSLAELTEAGGLVFFRAYVPETGLELWVSDGTPEGTHIVKDIYPGGASSLRPSSPGVHPTEFNDVLYFQATAAYSEPWRLWRTDGTEAGTYPVEGYPGGGIYAVEAAHDALFFSGHITATGLELWRTDGTELGTRLVKDIIPGWLSSQPEDLTAADGPLAGLLFFTAATSETGRELWVSDGTEAGTHLVKDIFLGTGSSRITELTSANGTMYFNALDLDHLGTHGYELWRSNGTAAGTYMVEDLNSGSRSTSPDELTVVGDLLYFSGFDWYYGVELWRSDGTPEGTYGVKDINPSGRSSYPKRLTAVDGGLVFTATHLVYGTELWASDGTPDGTHMVVDLTIGYGASSFTSDYPDLLEVDGTVVYQARYSVSYYSTTSQLLRTGPAVLGTIILSDTVVGSSSSPSYLTEFNELLFLAADDGVYGSELWSSDGTPEGTQLFQDLSPGYASATPSYLTEANGLLFFNGPDADYNERRLWRTDGTELGTHRIDLYDGTQPEQLTEALGLLFFTYENGYGRELWASDGTPEGTYMVSDIEPGPGSSDPERLTEANGLLFFTAEAALGREVYRTDGTPEGTFLLKDIGPGGTGSYTYSLAEFNGALYFDAYDGVAGSELWTSDGTPEGTYLFKDIVPGPGPGNPYLLTVANGLLFFGARTESAGQELWASDGTPEGTSMVKDIAVGEPGSRPLQLTTANGLLFFTAETSETGRELWRSDGMELGTVLVEDIVPGAHSSQLSALSEAQGRLVFAGFDDAHGQEVWLSNGTASGTFMVDDIAAGPRSSSPADFTSAVGHLFFSADDSINGRELWALPLAVNEPPVVGVDQQVLIVDEGQPAQNTGTVSDGDGDTVTLTASIGTVTNSGDGTWSWDFTPGDGPAAWTVTITADDGNGGTADVTFELLVDNVAPVVGPIFVPTDPVNITDQPLLASADFYDPAGTDDEPYVCTVNYGDGEGPQMGTVVGTTCTGPDQTYGAAGVYLVTVDVTDKDGGSGSAAATEFIVIYDPTGGFVTGGGWIDSAAGAYVPDPSLAGKASFGFVSKYKKGATVPTGNTEFQFKVADLNFKSTSYDWLVIAGDNAKYKGIGTINGEDSFEFMLWGGDGTPDTFRIRIWTEVEETAEEIVIYDNGSDQSLGGGSIVVHTAKK